MMTESNADYAYLQEGDEVLLKATVKWGPDMDSDGEIYLSIGYHSMSAKEEDIVGIVSRRFRPGDHVTNGRSSGTVALVSGSEVVVKTPTGLNIVCASDLTRVAKNIRPETNHLEAAE